MTLRSFTSRWVRTAFGFAFVIAASGLGTLASTTPALADVNCLVAPTP